MDRSDLKSSTGTSSKQTDFLQNPAENTSNDAVLLIDFGSSENSEDLNMGGEEKKEDENFEADFDGFFKKSPNIAINITEDSDESNFESSDKDLTTKSPGGFFSVDFEAIPDVNVYQHKKTVAQGMMDLALFSANANQLRFVFENPNQFYYYPGVTLILMSLIFQVLVGIGLILNTRYNVKNRREICLANKINNFTIIGIFLITIINVFISAFGVAANSSNDTTNLNLSVVPKAANYSQQ
nr:uncharacterized protein LOC111413247 [Onthophagus taurus]